MTEPLVTIDQGQLRGRTCTDANGGVYYSFQGIPYAKPPTGKLRFKAPQPPENWEGVLDATKEGNECYQMFPLIKKRVGSEDCLNLNVYTPQLLGDGINILKPVMVWIHGGGFTSGSNKTDMYGPDYLVTENVVLVTINYRLGCLGFLSLEDPSLGVPGNAGLKDQVMALKWVQNNISKFGGDPFNVTIFGESAGSASVHLLVLSPMAKGLFHKAIAQSGTAINLWARGRQCGHEMAKVLGFDLPTDAEILNFLQKVPAERLLDAQEAVKDPLPKNELRPFGPVVEKTSEEPFFLPEEPMDLLRSGNYNQVPLMMGFTDNEGLVVEMMLRMQGKQPKPTFENVIPYNLNAKEGTPEWNRLEEKFKLFYFGNETPSMENWQKSVTMESDGIVVRGVHKSIQYHAATSKFPIFYYIFSFDGKLNLLKALAQCSLSGAAHGDELPYLFKFNPSPEVEPGSPEDATVKRMTKLWTNFAKHGDPNPPEKDELFDVEWKPVASDNELNYLEIGEKLSSGTNPYSERMKFWDSIFQAHPDTKYY